MKKLTSKQAERCAIVYGARKCSAGEHGLGYEHWIYEGLPYIKTFPTDPYFWFPRLWDRLEEVHKKDMLGFALYSGYRIHSGERSCWVSPDSYAAPPSINPCLALCEAIEALEEK